MPYQKHAGAGTGTPLARTGQGAASALERLQAEAPRHQQPSELLVATAEGGDAPLESTVPRLLAVIKERMRMDVVFVSEFVDGRRVFRYVDVPADAAVIRAGASDPLESSWCARVVDGRLPGLIPDARTWLAQGAMEAPPFPIGTHLSVPIVLQDGSVYGTLCCFSFSVRDDATARELETLRAAAGLLADGLASARSRGH